MRPPLDRLYPALDDTVTCEHGACTTMHDMPRSHSFVIGLNRLTWLGKRAYSYSYAQCDAVQHFTCCHDHALAEALYCIQTHAPDLPDETMRYSYLTNPLGICPVCDQSIQRENQPAYFYSTCYALPGYSNKDTPYTTHVCQESHNWCCSIEHAKQDAMRCLHEHYPDHLHG